jgi:hypothetical protein
LGVADGFIFKAFLVELYNENELMVESGDVLIATLRTEICTILSSKK